MNELYVLMSMGCTELTELLLLLSFALLFWDVMMSRFDDCGLTGFNSAHEFQGDKSAM